MSAGFITERFFYIRREKDKREIVQKFNIITQDTCKCRVVSDRRKRSYAFRISPLVLGIPMLGRCSFLILICLLPNPEQGKVYHLLK